MPTLWCLIHYLKKLKIKKTKIDSIHKKIFFKNAAPWEHFLCGGNYEDLE